MELRTTYAPKEIQEALTRRHWKYTYPGTVLHSVSSGDLTIGVIGEPGNASYEWFCFDHARNAIVEASDDGWGSPAAALKFALNKFDI